MLITLLILLLLSNALTLQKDKSMLFSRVVIVSLMSSSFLVWNNFLIKPLEKGIGVYGGLFHVTTFTHTFNMFLFIISAIILTLTAYFPRKVEMIQHSTLYNLFFSKVIYNKSVIANTTGEQFTIIEYALIVVFVICGAVFLISTSDLISLFLSIELQSYGLYILSTLYRDSEIATGSGLTYFLLGGLSSCFILLGSALLYANSGTTSLDDLYVITSLSDVNSLPDLIVWYQPLYIRLSLIIMSVGLLFRMGALIFRFWFTNIFFGIPCIEDIIMLLFKVKFWLKPWLQTIKIFFIFALFCVSALGCYGLIHYISLTDLDESINLCRKLGSLYFKHVILVISGPVGFIAFNRLSHRLGPHFDIDANLLCSLLLLMMYVLIIFLVEIDSFKFFQSIVVFVLAFAWFTFNIGFVDVSLPYTKYLFLFLSSILWYCLIDIEDVSVLEAIILRLILTHIFIYQFYGGACIKQVFKAYTIVALVVHVPIFMLTLYFFPGSMVFGNDYLRDYCEMGGFHFLMIPLNLIYHILYFLIFLWTMIALLKMLW